MGISLYAWPLLFDDVSLAQVAIQCAILGKYVFIRCVWSEYHEQSIADTRVFLDCVLFHREGQMHAAVRQIMETPHKNGRSSP